MSQIRRRGALLVVVLVAGALAVGAILWQTIASGTQTQPSRKAATVYTAATDADTCIEQARAFGDYPLVFAGPSVLGYPLVSCQHMRTETRYAPDGHVSHPGGDSWNFVYGRCTIPEGRENCTPPIGIGIDPCALTVDGRSIPKASQAAGGMTVRGIHADVTNFGIHFEQSPQIISIGAPGSSPDERTANAVKIAEALVPANELASALSRGAPLTSAFAASPDTLCRNTFVPAAPATAAATTAATPTPASPTLTIAVGAPSLVGGEVLVPITVGGDAASPYAGFNLHVRWDPKLFSYLPAKEQTNSVLAAPYCPAPLLDSDGGGATYSCIVIGEPVKATGILTTIVLSPQAESGCSTLHLFTFGEPDGGDAVTGTYMVDAVSSKPQAVRYADGSASVKGERC